MNKEFYIKCGNWTVKIVVDGGDYECNDDLYMEAATRGFDLIFGEKEYDDDDVLVALMDEDGNNVFDKDAGEYEVQPTFTLLTQVYVIDKHGKHKMVNELLTSDIFANAEQHENYNQCIEIENEENND